MPQAALPFIALGIGAAGTVVSTVGQIKAGNAAKNVGEFNAQTSEQNARLALEDASIAETQQRYRDRQVMGRARALVGASGVELSGSPLNVLAENARQAELDALLIRRGGALEAEAFRREATSQRIQGKNAQAASRYGAAGSLLTGGYQVAKAGSELLNLRRPSFKPQYPGQQPTSFPG